MLADILRGAFALARQRPGLVLLDILWRLVWFVLTLAMLCAAVVWIASGVHRIAWKDAGVPGLNALIAAVLLGDYWNAHRSEIALIASGILFLSLLLWIFLEAVCRRKMVRDVYAASGVSAQAAAFQIFFASGVVKYLFLLTGGVLMALIWAAGAGGVAVVSFAAVAFLFGLVDTLVRGDAIDLLGTDLFRVAALLGILEAIEGMVAASLLALLVGAASSAEEPRNVAAMAGAAAAAAMFINLMHSYLLLVRFSAIAIMRRNVVEI
jgi:hypothetical protein